MVAALKGFTIGTAVVTVLAFILVTVSISSSIAAGTVGVNGIFLSNANIVALVGAIASAFVLVPLFFTHKHTGKTCRSFNYLTFVGLALLAVTTGAVGYTMFGLDEASNAANQTPVNLATFVIALIALAGLLISFFWGLHHYRKEHTEAGEEMQDDAYYSRSRTRSFPSIRKRAVQEDDEDED